MCSLYLGDQIISGQATLVGESRNIGQIIPSTIPLTDAGLHLLDGALIQGSGIYSAFVDYIASIYDLTANYFCTEAEWQTAVTTYGVCGKFVYDSVNNTVRLPKVTGIIEGTTDVSALGDLVEAGLPNIEGNVALRSSWGNSNNTKNGVFKDSYSYGNDENTSSSSGTMLNFDASLSNSIYGNSTTVQPQTIKAFYYIVIATSTKTDIQVDIDEIATDLNGKVDKSSLQEVQCVVETYVNGSSGYRIWSDGYCEQWCYKDNWGNIGSYTFLKPFKDTNYIVVFNGYKDDSTSNLGITSRTTTSIVYNNSDASLQGSMLACGYIEV